MVSGLWVNDEHQHSTLTFRVDSTITPLTSVTTSLKTSSQFTSLPFTTFPHKIPELSHCRLPRLEHQPIPLYTVSRRADLVARSSLPSASLLCPALSGLSRTSSAAPEPYCPADGVSRRCQPERGRLRCPLSAVSSLRRQGRRRTPHRCDDTHAGDQTTQTGRGGAAEAPRGPISREERATNAGFQVLDEEDRTANRHLAAAVPASVFGRSVPELNFEQTAGRDSHTEYRNMEGHIPGDGSDRGWTSPERWRSRRIGNENPMNLSGQCAITLSTRTTRWSLRAS